MSEIHPCPCGPHHIEGRACSSSEKRALLEKLLSAWEQHPHERLGQFILNALHYDKGAGPLYYIEDDMLLRTLGRRP
jgi:hypothetical protein